MFNTNNAQSKNAYAGEITGSPASVRAPLSVEILDALDQISGALHPVRGNLADVHGRLFGFDSGDKESGSIHPAAESFEGKLSVKLQALLALANELSVRSSVLASRI